MRRRTFLRMIPLPRRTRLAALPALLLAALPVAAQEDRLAGLDDRGLYRAACAACHGADGTGAPAYALGFATPLPDFTDCSFATREPDADWLAVAHEGGPVRGFARMMPAFGGALSEAQIARVLRYVRTLCGDDAWPRGELNLPRPMFTEKAYPEDEAVWTSGATLDGPGEVTGELTYERRFGARNQVEVVVPVAWRERDGGGWRGGLGDVVVGLKRAVFHDLDAGAIVSAAAELKLPTGDRDAGFGAGTPVFEGFLSAGQLLPGDAFLQGQAILELPFDGDRAAQEAALRVAGGRTFTSGRWGRAWTPMVEALASRELEGGNDVAWDLVPQLQVTMNTRQHLMVNLALRLPVAGPEGREPRILVYVLWDWFDGGLLDGW